MDLSKDISNTDEKSDESLIAALRGKTQKLNNNISKMNKNLSKLKEDITAKSNELSALEAQIDGLLPVSNSQQEIMNYLASENKERIKRHENRKKILDNLSISDFPSASPLDLAM